MGDLSRAIKAWLVLNHKKTRGWGLVVVDCLMWILSTETPKGVSHPPPNPNHVVGYLLLECRPHGACVSGQSLDCHRAAPGLLGVLRALSKSRRVRCCRNHMSRESFMLPDTERESKDSSCVAQVFPSTTSFALPKQCSTVSLSNRSVNVCRSFNPDSHQR